MCELVQELGMHYKMKPEALANNVVFTIGECLLTFDPFFLNFLGIFFIAWVLLTIERIIIIALYIPATIL